jgi:hypothetical protein
MYRDTRTDSYEEVSLVDEVPQFFKKARRAGFFHKIISILTRRLHCLLDLNSCPSQKRYGHFCGEREVPLEDIRGSESRQKDFDDCFHPLTDRIRRRWLNVARANDQGVCLPPVELIQVGGVYFVRDGHHRISVARTFGQTTINARVTVWET